MELVVMAQLLKKFAHRQVKEMLWRYLTCSSVSNGSKQSTEREFSFNPQTVHF
jgi:hypothetical protein